MTTLDEVTLANGHARGRVVPPLVELTFSTGVTVQIRPLALLTLQAIGTAARRELSAERPAPPLQDVTDLEGKKIKIANADEPGYLAALAEYDARVQMEIARRTMRVIALRAVEVEVDHEWVAQFRADMAVVDTAIDGDDKELYLYHYAAPTGEDIANLQRAVLQRSQPTEAAVKEHIDTFPGDVSGA